MTYEQFMNNFALLHPRPEKPLLRNYLLRVDLILLILAALGGVIFSASRTFTLIAEQSGNYIAAFAVLALEFSMAGLILSQARKRGKFIDFLRVSAVWVTIALLLFILIVTNASYEIKSVGLVVAEQGLKIVLVVFLGVMIPILVVINLENLSVRIPEYLGEFRQDNEAYYRSLADWNDLLDREWKAEQDKEYIQDRPNPIYSKEERREFIQEQLKSGKQPNRSKLAEKFGVSVTTIINDIRDLTSDTRDKIESGF